MSNQKFWMVHGDGPSRVRHPDKRAARAEAKRLARENPGTVFFVLEVVTGYVKDDVREIEIDDLSNEIPF